ncbi:L-serine ammonia-lyase [Microcella alkaliphila]|uniref:L-serine dehydratase n=1 Tax=Microcella alkaliphila TaxID=279828 RepID=A0A0U5B728_9MICO|nr:L-serine ammonia-lyase [Microcella alkaliphila]BAU31689.1 L-serine deaminase [Microcella alkaliphila]
MSIPVALASPLAERTYISVLDLFRVGIGPSSSHTVGPLRAARAFVDELAASSQLDAVARVECVLFGSLGSTGAGHGTPGAVLAGLAGCDVETVTRDDVARVTADADNGMLALRTTHPVAFADGWLRFAPRELKPRHPNALTLTAFDADGVPLRADTYYSVGGGFVEHDGDDPAALARAASPRVPYPFATMVELLALCRQHGLSIAELARANEAAIRGEAETSIRVAAIAEAMNACIDAGLTESGTLPGSLHVTRRAAAMAARLRDLDAAPTRDTSLEWLQAYAIAVNEENAAGGRVVTAPTNGAAGIIPAVMRHALDVIPEAAADPTRAQKEFLLVAGAIGALIKSNASISGAEAGCQGEVGSAASMAAAGFAHLLGGSNEQVENAAEIAMEHSLGLTCDPVAGLVQLPCIERNAIGAGKAVAAARLAMNGDGTHLISFDTVVETMRQTGLDMSSKYKETSEGGLAVNVVEC